MGAMMTEDEACGKCCPLLVIAGEYIANNDCIASECMMWRWKLDSDGNQMVSAMKNGEPLGYCGLAG